MSATIVPTQRDASAVIWDVISYLEPLEPYNEIDGEFFNTGKRSKSGVYAFFGYEGAQERYVYVGKAKCLRARIQQHLGSDLKPCSPWVDRLFADVWKDKLYLPLGVKVWFSNNRAGLESTLIQQLRPIYNKREE
jgi:hypothetical protein